MNGNANPRSTRGDARTDRGSAAVAEARLVEIGVAVAAVELVFARVDARRRAGDEERAATAHPGRQLGVAALALLVFVADPVGLAEERLAERVEHVLLLRAKVTVSVLGALDVRVIAEPLLVLGEVRVAAAHRGRMPTARDVCVVEARL